jgi:hypothetical protein
MSTGAWALLITAVGLLAVAVVLLVFILRRSGTVTSSIISQSLDRDKMPK